MTFIELPQIGDLMNPIVRIVILDFGIRSDLNLDVL